MALIILVLVTILVILAVKWRNRKRLFAATIGVLTFMVVPLYSRGDIPLSTQMIFALLRSLPALLLSAILAIIVYGGTGLLVEWYVRTSGDIRRIKIGFSALLGAIVSGLVYNVIIGVMFSGAKMGYGALTHILGVGALVAVVVAFVLTHERPTGMPFFHSRDGGTVVSAIVAALAIVGGLNIVMQQIPGHPYPMRGIVTYIVVGGLLGAGLTIPLRAVGSGRLARAALGALIGAVALAAVLRSNIGAPPIEGILAGAAVGALLPDEEPVEDAKVVVGAEE